MSELTKCIWCHQGIHTTILSDYSETVVACDTCGPYSLPANTSLSTNIGMAEIPVAKHYLVSAWIRQQFRKKNNAPTIDLRTAGNIVANAETLEPWDKAIKLLLAVGEHALRPGVLIPIGYLKYPDAVAEDEKEYNTYLDWLRTYGFIEGKSGDSLKISLKGWQEISRIKQKHVSTSTRAFVAMWFDNSMDDAFNSGIKPACKEAGFDAYRVKEDLHSERIDARIIAGIRESRFLIADVTGERTAVYYEAGFADGLGKQVIWTCHKDHKDKMSFDTRQFTHILWDTPQDLKAQLVPMIKARIV